MKSRILGFFLYSSTLLTDKGTAIEATSSSSSNPALNSCAFLSECRGGETRETDNADLDAASLLAEMNSHGDNSDKVSDTIKKAMVDFAPKDPRQGSAAWTFLSRLASSPTFLSKYWHKKPLLLRSNEIISITKACSPSSKYNDDDSGDNFNWVRDAFTLSRDLKLIDNSYIMGHRTDDILRNGTTTDTWLFKPIKDDPTRPTTWNDVEVALNGGTIYFNTAGSLWPTLGALCRLTSKAFGIPSNVNVYVTPPGVTLSVPPHTDRQDVIVFQTEGSKRWRVYAPPRPRKKGVDPLNRGKSGDVISEDELGAPLLDVVLRKGDVMYVPIGFPHTTDTHTVVEDGKHNERQNESDDQKRKDIFDETSVHLTMGIDTHVWALTYAHLRWTLLQRCGKEWNVDIKDDDAYWDAMKTIPIGFLDKSSQRNEDGENKDAGSKHAAVQGLKNVLVRLEPDRWAVHDNTNGKEKLPTNEEIEQVIEYMTQNHLISLLEIQEDMFTDVNPHREETIVKAYQCSQKQNKVMENYGAFSNNEGMRNAFAQRRMQGEQKASSAGRSSL